MKRNTNCILVDYYKHDSLKNFLFNARCNWLPFTMEDRNLSSKIEGESRETEVQFHLYFRFPN